jgi:hypothetical protein
LRRVAEERKAEEKRREVTLESTEVGDWLDGWGLGQYAPAFLANGFVRLQYVSLMSNDDIARVGVTLPGHVKALRAALAEIRHAYPDTRADEQRRIDRSERLAAAVDDARDQLTALRDDDAHTSAVMADVEKQLAARVADRDNASASASSNSNSSSSASAEARAAAAAARKAKAEQERVARNAVAEQRRQV